jgi:hypothetical protein
LTPFSVLYELRPDDGLPSEEEIDQVTDLTIDYLIGYFLQTVAGIDRFSGEHIDDRFIFGEAFAIDYAATATFRGDSVIPPVSTLDAVLVNAFTEPALSVYMDLLATLPPENPFADPTAVRLEVAPEMLVSTTSGDSTTGNGESSVMSSIEKGVSAGAVAAVFAGLVAGILFCRRRREEFHSIVKSGDHRVTDSLTLAGETVEETVEFEYPGKTASEKAQSEWGLSTHFEEEGSTYMPDHGGLYGDGDEDEKFDVADEMENMAMFQPLGPKFGDAGDLQGQSRARAINKAAIEESTPPIPTPTSSSQEEYVYQSRYDIDDGTLEVDDAEEKQTETAGLFSHEASLHQGTRYKDSEEEDEDEVPVRVVDMVRRFG